MRYFYLTNKSVSEGWEHSNSVNFHQPGHVSCCYPPDKIRQPTTPLLGEGYTSELGTISLEDRPTDNLSWNNNLMLLRVGPTNQPASNNVELWGMMCCWWGIVKTKQKRVFIMECLDRTGEEGAKEPGARGSNNVIHVDNTRSLPLVFQNVNWCCFIFSVLPGNLVILLKILFLSSNVTNGGGGCRQLGSYVAGFLRRLCQFSKGKVYKRASMAVLNYTIFHIAPISTSSVKHPFAASCPSACYWSCFRRSCCPSFWYENIKSK